jgi:hypothetical protein
MINISIIASKAIPPIAHPIMVATLLSLFESTVVVDRFHVMLDIDEGELVADIVTLAGENSGTIVVDPFGSATGDEIAVGCVPFRGPSAAVVGVISAGAKPVRTLASVGLEPPALVWKLDRKPRATKVYES